MGRLFHSFINDSLRRRLYSLGESGVVLAPICLKDYNIVSDYYTHYTVENKN